MHSNEDPTQPKSKIKIKTKKKTLNFKECPGGAVGKNLPANAGDTGSSPDLERYHMPWSS